MNSKSRVNHEEYQSMLATILRLSVVELRLLAESLEKFAAVTEHEEAQGERA
jgi:hypothetical protein